MDEYTKEFLIHSDIKCCEYEIKNLVYRFICRRDRSDIYYMDIVYGYTNN